PQRGPRPRRHEGRVRREPLIRTRHHSRRSAPTRSHGLSEKTLASRVEGRAAVVTTVVRVAAGVFFISVSISKFTDHAKELADFHRYGVPIADVAVYGIGTIELIGGIALMLGLLTRVAALVLAGDMIGAIA